MSHRSETSKISNIVREMLPPAPGILTQGKLTMDSPFTVSAASAAPTARHILSSNHNKKNSNSSSCKECRTNFVRHSQHQQSYYSSKPLIQLNFDPCSSSSRGCIFYVLLRMTTKRLIDGTGMHLESRLLFPLQTLFLFISGNIELLGFCYRQS